MKKKLKIASSAAIVAIALVVSVSISNNGSGSDVNLQDLFVGNTANAECHTDDFLGGKCLQLSQICVGDPFPEDWNCDPTIG